MMMMMMMLMMLMMMMMMMKIIDFLDLAQIRDSQKGTPYVGSSPDPAQPPNQVWSNNSAQSARGHF